MAIAILEDDEMILVRIYIKGKTRFSVFASLVNLIVVLFLIQMYSKKILGVIA